MITRWDELPTKVQNRLMLLKPILVACFKKGLQMDILGPEVIDVSDAGYSFGGKAIYQRWNKILAATKDIMEGTALEYGLYRADIHELGHAVFYLLLSTVDRWTKFRLLYRQSKFTDWYISQAPASYEEWWAQVIEAFCTKDGGGGEWGIDWSRSDLKKADPKTYIAVDALMKSFGMNTQDSL